MWQAAELQSLKARVEAQDREAITKQADIKAREDAFEKRQKDQQTHFENRMRWYGFILAVCVLAWGIWKETHSVAPPKQESQPKQG